MPKLTIKNIISAHGALLDLSQNDRANKFVFSSAIRLRLALNLRQTRPVFENYEERRVELVEKLGSPATASGTSRVKPENLPTFKAEHDAMLKEETDVQLNPLKEAELGENQIPFDTLAALLDSGLLV